MIRTFFRFIFRTFYWLCAIVGFGLLAVIAILYFAKLGPFTVSPKVEADAILTVTLRGSYVEHVDTGGIESLILGENASLYNLTRALHHAAQDERIKGLVIHLETPHLGAAQIQELREALLAFRKQGKPSWCYTESLGEFSSGTALYYLATACQEIWLQPLGTVNLTGLTIEVPFIKKALEKLEIKPEMSQRKEYKSFVETFTRDSFSEANKEALQAISDSILSQFVDGISETRKIPHERVRFLIHNGPYLTEEALKEKLVDRVAYRQHLIPMLQEKLGTSLVFMSVEKYLKTLASDPQGDRVALIFGSGIIQSDGDHSPLNEFVISSHTTYKAFQCALADNNVKAIVYRINSGGGSAVASETIYGIIQYAKDHAHKPVIISMSDAAASGGYWIASAGSKIIAQPATLTGSIGVFGGKFLISGFLEKLGISVGHISTSENATMWSMTESFTPSQWIKINALMDQIYNQFTSRVAKGRKMTPEQVEKVARGRVWTGEQALALGLVDQLGSLQTALDIAKQEGGLSPDAAIQIYPLRKTFWETVSALFEGKEDDSLCEGTNLQVLIKPFQHIWRTLTLLFASQETLYTPLGEVK